MHIKKLLATAAVSVVLTYGLTAPQEAMARDAGGGQAIVNTGCHWTAYPVNTQYVWGAWAATMWHSGGCNSRWGSFDLHNYVNESWRPAQMIRVFVSGPLSVINGTMRGYFYNGTGYYYSWMTPYTRSAYSSCGVIDFGWGGIATNCSYSGP